MTNDKINLEGLKVRVYSVNYDDVKQMTSGFQ